jgi:NADH-quinone oxidoreductase subunit G
VVERDGTYTNAERRVQRSRQAQPAVGQSRPDWQIVQGVAQLIAEDAKVWIAEDANRLAKDANAKGAKGAKVANAKSAKAAVAVAVADAPAWDYLTAGELAAEIAERVPGYAGITYAALAATGSGGAWGRQANEAIFYDGTNYENTEGVGIQYPSQAEGRAVFSLAPRPAPAPAAAAERPLLLLAQPLAYDGDPLLRGGKLESHVPTAYVAVGQADAAGLGVQAGEMVRLASAVGELALPARVVADLPEGVVVVPANWPGANLAAIQTGPRTYVSVLK